MGTRTCRTARCSDAANRGRRSGMASPSDRELPSVQRLEEAPQGRRRAEVDSLGVEVDTPEVGHRSGADHSPEVDRHWVEAGPAYRSARWGRVVDPFCRPPSPQAPQARTL
jgi:hypothetical protein